MSRNRYVSDYHLADSLDERGRIRTEVEYVGSLYSFSAPAEKVRQAKKRSLGLCAAGWVAYIGAMIPLSAAMRTVYTALPFALAAVPLALLTGTVLEVMPLKERFLHRYADRLENRYPASAAFLVFLPALCLVGEAVSLLRGAAVTAGDLLYSLGAAVLLAAGILARRIRENLRCEKAG